MCATCTTVIDVAAINSVVILAGVANGWNRVCDLLAGRSRTSRQMEVWEANASFIRSLGLDPMSTLGPPPAAPIPAHVDESTSLESVET
jgi:hypothetical protein